MEYCYCHNTKLFERMFIYSSEVWDVMLHGSYSCKLWFSWCLFCSILVGLVIVRTSTNLFTIANAFTLLVC